MTTLSQAVAPRRARRIPPVENTESSTVSLRLPETSCCGLNVEAAAMLAPLCPSAYGHASCATSPRFSSCRNCALVLVTCGAGFYLGGGGFFPRGGSFSPDRQEPGASILTGGLWCALLGIGLVSAGAGALNKAFEHRTDARMKRTAGPRVAAGRFSLAQGAWPVWARWLWVRSG